MNTISAGWADAITRFLAFESAGGHPATTIKTRRQHLHHLARRVHAEPFELTPDELIEYAGLQPWMPETRRGRRTTFIEFYRWAIRRGFTDTSPAEQLPLVRASAPNPRPVPDDVYLTALARADADEAVWIDLAAEHGLRRAEIAQIHSEDIQPTLLGYDLIVHGKGSKLRQVPLTGAMARTLMDRGPGFAFPGDRDGHISAEYLGKRVARLLDGDWTIHKLRHRAATRFYVASSGDAYAVAELMGWSNINMVRVYVKLPDDKLRNIVEGSSRFSPLLSR